MPNASRNSVPIAFYAIALPIVAAIAAVLGAGLAALILSFLPNDKLAMLFWWVPPLAFIPYIVWQTALLLGGKSRTARIAATVAFLIGYAAVSILLWPS